MTYTIPSEENGSFKAMAHSRGDYTVDVIKTESKFFGNMMTILATEEAIYITKDQASEFFGFGNILKQRDELVKALREVIVLANHYDRLKIAMVAHEAIGNMDSKV